jgi:hypothetical protein
MRGAAVYALLILTLIASPRLHSTAQLAVSARLVRDINQIAPQIKGSAPTDLITIGTTTYFAADDGSNERELTKTLAQSCSHLFVPACGSRF